MKASFTRYGSLALLLALHALADLAATENGWRQYLLLVFFAQPALLAMWAGCGQRLFVSRLFRAGLLTTSAYFMVFHSQMPAGNHKTGWDQLGLSLATAAYV